MRHGELLNNGELYTENLRSAAATTLYYAKGGLAEEHYEPRFTFYGFRYLEITGWPGELTADVKLFPGEALVVDALPEESEPGRLYLLRTEAIPGYAALVNDDQEAARVFRVGSRLLGKACTIEKRDPSMGGEDFSFFCDVAPGAFFHLGCTAKENLPAPLLHSRDFKLDEDCLTVGALMHVALVLDGQQG